MSPPDTCIFCKTSDEDEITGELQKTPGGRIVAHYNCMLYSPRVLSINSQEDTGFEFDIESVLLEIGRGKNLTCNFCKKRGATVGCDVESCRRTYHYPCVQKANGSPSPDRYVIYCAWHKSENTAHGSKDIGGKTKKRMARSSANQTLNWEDYPEIGDGCKRRISIRNSGKYIGHKDVFYLSPEGEQFRSKKKLQRHLGKFKDKTPSPAEKNDETRAGDALSGRSDVTDSAPGSDNPEIGKAPETQLGMSVRVNLSRISAEKQHCPGEQPASPQGALSTQLNGVPQTSSQQFEDSRRCSLRSGKAARKRKHLTCRNCSVPLPDAYKGKLCRNCFQKESGVLLTQLNAVPQMSSQQFEDSRRYSLRSGKAISKRKHLTCKNCNVLLPDSYEDMLCRNCLQKESAKKRKIQWNSCQDQYCKKLTDQQKSHNVPPKKRPYIFQDQTLTDLRANTDSLDDPEEGEGGDCDASQIDHPAADTPLAGGTYSPQATPEDTSEPATSSMAPVSALAGTHHSHGVDPAPGPDNDSQVLENLSRSTHVDMEENFLQSLAPYLHKLPTISRLRMQEAIIVILQAAMPQNDP